MAPLPCELQGIKHWKTQDALLMSDLHLSAASPQAMQAFETLMLTAANQYESLLILGDLFEVYAGDDGLVHDAFIARVAAILKFASQHCKVGLMHGNRDFLIGQSFLTAAGAQLLADPCVLSVGSQANVLLSHGDAWCTLDTAYQSKKLEIRSPAWQQAVLNMPWAQRSALAASYREQSMAQRTGHAVDLAQYDVQALDFEAECIQNKVSIGLHGHTHLPARHVTAISRLVMGDWQFDRCIEHPKPQGHAVVAVVNVEGHVLHRYDGKSLSRFE